LPVVLCEGESWSLTLREERRFREFENRVLRRILRPTRDEVPGEFKRLYNEELKDLYSSATTVRVIKSRRMRWAGIVARMQEGRGVYMILVGKPERKRPLWRHYDFPVPDAVPHVVRTLANRQRRLYPFCLCLCFSLLKL
jgi:hypothetical protein